MRWGGNTTPKLKHTCYIKFFQFYEGAYAGGQGLETVVTQVELLEAIQVKKLFRQRQVRLHTTKVFTSAVVGPQGASASASPLLCTSCTRLAKMSDQIDSISIVCNHVTLLQ